ncbi:hypothetical protein, partial [Paenirhodobacter sp. CAU 1674]|uniref:hypothetical protein n=1 Tax=Paenirhodobacter sp. CAU 1674 TaxID=3032596 RepID=UPI0023DA0E76
MTQRLYSLQAIRGIAACMVVMHHVINFYGVNTNAVMLFLLGFGKWGVNIFFVLMTCHGIFPPPSIRVRANLRTDNEANEIHGRTDHRYPGGARG